MMELLVIPTFVLDMHGKVIIWNRACERLTGVAAQHMIGTSRHWSGFYKQQRPTLADLLVQQLRDELDADLRLYFAHHQRHADHDIGQHNISAESWCDMPRAGGNQRYLAVDASPIHDSDGKLIAVVETMRDMTDEKRAQSALERLATRDSLTGLANRRCFDETLHAEWQRASRQQQALSLLMVDVDNFKEYNDAFGHLGGDDCLRRVAGAVASELRTNDLVARYGGEEFAVILPNQALKGAAIVAERIRRRVEQLQLPRLKSGAACVTVSIGAATALAAHEAGPGQLLAIADAALYRAKHMGRNRISLPEHDAPASAAPLLTPS
nr:diguanylate cyclase [Janthinobacterium agaricidamnosum]